MAGQNQLGPIKYGKDFNFYREFTINSSTFGGDSADGYLSPSDGYAANCMIPFSTYTVIFTNESGAASKVVEFSFNGTSVHGILKGDTTATSRILTFTNRVIGKIWFRVQSGSTSPGANNITVSAWGIR